MSAYEYSDTRNSSHGTMICCSCHKPITEGQYRVRQKHKAGDWSYQTCHQACCPTDPEWAAMVEREAARALWSLQFSEACAAFRDKWGVSELDDYILTTTPESN